MVSLLSLRKYSFYSFLGGRVTSPEKQHDRVLGFLQLTSGHLVAS